MNPISLFTTIQTEKKGSERAELIKFFHENILGKTGKQYRVQFIAIKLSHLQLPDLYYMKSLYSDIERRSGVESANKWWWFSLKSKDNGTISQ